MTGSFFLNIFCMYFRLMFFECLIETLSSMMTFIQAVVESQRFHQVSQIQSALFLLPGSHRSRHTVNYSAVPSQPITWQQGQQQLNKGYRIYRQSWGYVFNRTTRVKLPKVLLCLWQGKWGFTCWHQIWLVPFPSFFFLLSQCVSLCYLKALHLFFCFFLHIYLSLKK